MTSRLIEQCFDIESSEDFGYSNLPYFYVLDKDLEIDLGHMRPGQCIRVKDRTNLKKIQHGFNYGRGVYDTGRFMYWYADWRKI